MLFFGYLVNNRVFLIPLNYISYFVFKCKVEETSRRIFRILSIFWLPFILNWRAKKAWGDGTDGREGDRGDIGDDFCRAKILSGGNSEALGRKKCVYRTKRKMWVTTGSYKPVISGLYRAFNFNRDSWQFQFLISSTLSFDQL